MGVPDPERVEAMMTLRKQGLTYAEIGQRFGITRQGVHYLLRRHPEYQESRTK